MGWGWILYQSLLALQQAEKDTYYILHYIAEQFSLIKTYLKIIIIAETFKKFINL